MTETTSVDLPASYGRNRLVLLPVEPYLIHVYWDVESTSPPSSGARPILRFYESQAGHTRPFDVDIDFTTSSWYVNLWSPGKVYFAELGWRTDDGSFVPLVRSNVVQTPPASPRPAQPGETGPLAIAATPAPPEPVPNVEPAPILQQRPDQSPHLHHRLAELFAIRGELPPPHEEIPGEPSQLDAPISPPGSESWQLPYESDLTELSEERFTPGISSLRDPLGE